jgi:hypothetical protein
MEEPPQQARLYTSYSYKLKQVELRFPMEVLSDLPPEILTFLPQHLHLPVLSQSSSIKHAFLYSMLRSKGAATRNKLGEDFNCSWT